MGSREPFVSVITPFYNIAPYVAECIESVLAQTYRNFEYIIVDNQSTDGSGAIAEAYAARDSRIRFVRADVHRTQIQNYNYAIQLASPESRYIKFALGDDWLYPRSLEELVGVADANPTIGLVSSFELRGSDVFGTGLPPKVNVMSGRDAGRFYFFHRRFLFGSPTTVLYRADLVRARTPFFSEALHEDTEAVFQILSEHDFGFVHQVLCFIRAQDGSLTGRLYEYGDVALDWLIILKRFGHFFLTPAEFAERLRANKDWYYHDLASHWIAQWRGRRTPDFWAFQREHLASIGERLEWGSVLSATAGILVDNLLAPARLMRKLRAQP